jgi:hypothetical protein
MKEQSKLSTQKPSKQVGPLAVVCVEGCSSTLLAVPSIVTKESLFCCFSTSLYAVFCFLISENEHCFHWLLANLTTNHLQLPTDETSY